jgi:hypothetical protein
MGCLGISNAANAQSACIGRSPDLSARNEVNVALQVFGSRLVAVGRVDATGATFGVDVLGFQVQPSAGDAFQVGDYAAVVDWSANGAKDRLLEVRPLASRYVPGASEIYLKGFVAAANNLRGQVQLGTVVVDHTASILPTSSAVNRKGILLAIRGTQPAPQGVVLGACVSVASAEDSLETSRADGSLGTGKPEGSLGTGRPDGSMGTGRPDGSLGTGRPDGSLGTGKPDGSLGTGSSAD